MEGCYWIALPDKMARRDCDKEIFCLSKSYSLKDKVELAPYVGHPCPCCGKPVMVDEHSYELIKES